HLSGYSLALADEAEQNVLGADVAVSQLQRLTEAELEDLLRPRCEGNVSARCLLALSDDLLDLVAHLFEGDVHALESLRCQAFTLVDQAEQNVLGADVVVFEKFRFFLCEHHDAACSVGEPLEHIHPPRSSYSPEPNDDQRGSIAGFAMSRNRLAVGEIPLPSPRQPAEAAGRSDRSRRPRRGSPPKPPAEATGAADRAEAHGRATADRSGRAEGSRLLRRAAVARRTGFSVLR